MISLRCIAHGLDDDVEGQMIRLESSMLEIGMLLHLEEESPLLRNVPWCSRISNLCMQSCFKV